MLRSLFLFLDLLLESPPVREEAETGLGIKGKRVGKRVHLDNGLAGFLARNVTIDIGSSGRWCSSAVIPFSCVACVSYISCDGIPGVSGVSRSRSGAIIVVVSCGSISISV